jgi:hypothetical protein
MKISLLTPFKKIFQRLLWESYEVDYTIYNLQVIYS